MFTLKFQNANKSLCIEAEQFEVVENCQLDSDGNYQHRIKAIVPGDEIEPLRERYFYVGNAEIDWDRCFVENSSGKTINRIE